MKHFNYLLKREFNLFWSNKVFVFAFLVLPLLMSLVLGYVYKKGKVDHLPILIVDKDNTPLSIKFRDMLEDDDVLDVVQTSYESLNLQQALLSKQAVALVEIPYRFEADLLAGRKPEINCYLNLASTLTANTAGNAVNLCASSMNAGMAFSALTRKGVPDAIAFRQYPLLRYVPVYKYNPSGNYLYFLWPALIFSVMHQLLLLALAVSFSGEYARGEFNSKGLLHHTHSAALLLLVKILPFCMLSLVTIGIYFSLSQFFRIPIASAPLLLFASQLLFVAGACCLGTLYSIINPFPLKATQLLMTVSSPAFTLSGFTWPSDQAPAVLRAIGQAIPLTPYLQVLRMLLLQKAGIIEVIPQIKHQLVLLLIFFLLSAVLLKYKIRKSLYAGSIQ